VAIQSARAIVVNIYLVEANEQIRNDLMGVLRRSNYTCYGFSHAYEVFTRLNKYELAADVVIVGLDIPIMNGNSYIQAQINSFDCHHIPLIFVLPNSICTDEFFTTGHQRFLLNFRNIEELTGLIKEITGTKTFTKKVPLERQSSPNSL
jgi:response regulator RpfG family c-di-GMP phosphodiesterase